MTIHNNQPLSHELTAQPAEWSHGRFAATETRSGGSVELLEWPGLPEEAAGLKSDPRRGPAARPNRSELEPFYIQPEQYTIADRSLSTRVYRKLGRENIITRTS